MASTTIRVSLCDHLLATRDTFLTQIALGCAGGGLRGG